MFPRVCVILFSVLRFTFHIPHIALSIIRPFHFTSFSLITLLVITTFIAPRVNAQSGTIYDGYTPTGVAPGSPTGSYAVSDLEDINLFNGHLNLNFPLLRVGGRGAIGHTVLLNIQPLPWHIRPVFFLPGNELDIASDISYEPLVKYGPGALRVQHGVVGDLSPCDGTQWVSTLARLVFYTSDGTQLRLHDQVYQGKAVSHRCSDHPGPNRGRVFVSADGGSMTFISDTDVIDPPPAVSGIGNTISGNLMMKDGTLYRIDVGNVSFIRDRNGNKINFTYQGSLGQVTSITDSLNRQVTISYADQGVPYDTITFDGFGDANRAIKVWYSPLQAVLRPDFAIKTYKQLFPTPDANWGGPYDGNEIFNPGRVSKIELPNQKAYELYYNSYGELARLILPTGGGVDYDYVNGHRAGLMLSRRLSKRTSYTTLTSTTNPSNPPPGTVEGKQFYSMTIISHGTGVPETVVTVEHKDAGNLLLAQEKHYFYAFATEEAGGCLPTLYSPWYSGREFKTERYSVTNGALGSVLKRIEHTWYPNLPSIHYVCHQNVNVDPAPNPRIIQTTTTLLDTNQVTRQTFTHDQYNNVVEVDEYGYGNGAPGPLIRRTYTSYLTNNPWQNNVNYATDPNIHIRDLPTQISIFDNNDTEFSRMSFYYDVYSQAPLQDCPNIVQHDGGFNTEYGPRGNLVKTTKVTDFDQAANNIDNYFHYDIAGNVVKTIDGRGFPIDYEFTDRFGSPDDDAQENTPPTQLNEQMTYAFPTKVTNALEHTTYAQYDYYIGKPVNVEDTNGVVSSIAYNDTLDRPTLNIQARYIVGSIPAMRRQAAFTYDDVNRVISTTIDRAKFNDDTPLTSKSYYVGLGRNWRSAAYEGSTWAITDKQAASRLPHYRDKRGTVLYLPDTIYLYTSSWSEADKATERRANIDRFLERPRYAGGTYSLTPNRQGGKSFRRGARRF